MSNKVRLISTISAICMVLALLTVGVWAVSTASVTLGGSVSFTADNIHARVTGSVTGTQETINLAELNYSADTAPSEDNINTWANNQMTFTSENLITMTITVENLSEERSLFVTLTDNTTTTNVGKTLKQGALDYTSATAVEVTAGNTTTFTMTLSVTDTNKSASAAVSYQVDLRDANAAKNATQYSNLTFNYDNSEQSAIVKGNDATVSRLEIPSRVEYEGKTYRVTEIEEGAFLEYSNLTEVVLPNTIINIGDDAFANCTNLERVTLSTINPPAVGTTSFPSTTNIYVPTDSVINYVSSWTQYSNQIKDVNAVELLQDKENQYYYVNMGTYENTSVRWRVVGVNGEHYEYDETTYPQGRLMFALETKTISHAYNQSSSDGNDYSKSDIREYLTNEGEGGFVNALNIPIDNAVYSKISPRSITDLHTDIGWAITNIGGGQQYAPPEGTTQYASYSTTPGLSEGSDKLWLASIKEQYLILGGGELVDGTIPNDWSAYYDNTIWNSTMFWLRSPDDDSSYSAFVCCEYGYCYTKSVFLDIFVRPMFELEI